MLSEITLYHYHPKTKEYTGTTQARLSPLDLKHGQIIALRPPNTTEIIPPANAPKSSYVIMYFDEKSNKWKFKNTEVALKVARQKDWVINFINGGGYVLVENIKANDGSGFWYILYAFLADPPFYTEVHTQDQEWSGEREDKYSDLLYEIAVIEGRAEPKKNIDNEITDEEEQNSNEYWKSYEESAQSDIEKIIAQKENEFMQSLPDILENENVLAVKYVDDIKEIIKKEKIDNLNMLEQKKIYTLAIVKKKIAKIIQDAIVRNE